MEQHPLRADVCAVVVTYHPDSEFPVRLAALAAQVGAVIIVDNGSSAVQVNLLEQLAATAAVTLITNEHNAGVARALNQGVEGAAARGFDFALLMDQDSQVDEDLVEGLAAAYRDANDSRLALVGARFRDTSGQNIEAHRHGTHGADWDEVESVVTSGSLLSIAAYTVVGRFRDELFIDYVDTEFCWRARARGYRVIQTRRARMAHTVGTPTAHRTLGRTKWTTNHSADRRYYMARNDTALLREYGLPIGGSWLLKSLARSVRLCRRIALYESGKLRKIYAVWHGWWHGVRGRLGPR